MGWKRAFLFLIGVGALTACAAQTKILGTGTFAEVPEGTDRPVMDLFRSQIGTSWYGVYYNEIKVGWGKIIKELLPQSKSSQKTIRIQKIQKIDLLVNGYTHQLSFSLDVRFETKPPFALKRYELNQRVNDWRINKKLVKSGEVFRRTVISGKRRLRLPERFIAYTLADEMALEALVRRNPQVDDSVYIKYINSEDLQWDTGVANIVSIERRGNPDGSNKTYHIKHPPTGLGATTSVYRSDLTIEFQEMNTGFVIRNETKDSALAGIGQDDIYVNLMLTIEMPIGRSDDVRQVKLAVDARTGALLTDATGQRIEKDPNGKRYVVILDAEKSFRESADDREIERYLEISNSLRSDDNPFLKSARKALKGVDDLQQKIERLLTFVDETIEDSNEVLSPNLEYILTNRKGDCSEHAELFEALARAFDIPCRMVSGLMYLGDWAQSFGLHAWNEVFIDGYWLPVDSTHRDLNLPPFYIRFPVEQHANDKLSQSVQSIDIQLLEVKHFKPK